MAREDSVDRQFGGLVAAHVLSGGRKAFSALPAGYNAFGDGVIIRPLLAWPQAQWHCVRARLPPIRARIPDRQKDADRPFDV